MIDIFSYKLGKKASGGGTGGGGTGGGGGSTSVKMKDVNFYDYDGTLLHSYTVAEAQALTEMPPLPTQEGLICQGWNRTLEQLKQYDRKVDVGATYITDDGTTRIYITLREGRTSPMMGLYLNGTLTIDWGDGTTPDVLTGTSLYSVIWTPNHNYASAGDYVIKLTVDGEMGFYGSNSSNDGSGILRQSSTADVRNRVYQSLVNRVELGSGIGYILGNAFYNLISLKYVTIPNDVITNTKYVFGNCFSLKCVVIPNGKTTAMLNDHAFTNGYSLTRVILPDNIELTTDCFTALTKLTDIIIPNGVKSIPRSVFYSCYSLTTITIPDSVTKIESYAFSSTVLKYFDFTTCTKIPTLANSDAFSGLPDDFEIRVPAALYDEWIAATNWSSLASKIVAV